MTEVAHASGGVTVGMLPAISLEDLNQAASLQQRVDRKYIVDERHCLAMVDALTTRVAALEINGQRTFRYESVYFDTPEFESYLSAAFRRRTRFKVRTRSYLDGGSTMLEVKTRGTRGETVKTRQNYDFGNKAVVVPESYEFVDVATGRAGLSSRLSPVLATEYGRTTLVDLDDIARLTIDADLRCTDWKNNQVRLATSFVVETKTAGPPSAADRWLWSKGVRPTKISKFGTGLAALNPALPSNKWHRTINRHFAGGVVPRRHPSA